MSTPGTVGEVQQQLYDRRQRLQSAMVQDGDASQIRDLLQQVDAALERVQGGTFGICETCHDSIEPDRLARDPLIRYCLDHLGPEERQILQADLDLASVIQRKLLPNRQFSAAGWEAYYHYEPAGPVSGDYCDLLAEDDSIFFFLGDASGKGVAASLLMSQLHAMFRTLMTMRLSPGDLLERANKLFCEFMIPGQYATVVCGRADGSGRVELANAGHCLPIVHDGQNAPIQNASFPLGLFCSSDYSTTTLQLDKGEGLLLYSDGLVEADGPEGSSYGEARLLRALENPSKSAREVIEAVLKDLTQFQSRQARRDDLTVLSIRRAAAVAVRAA